MKTFGERLKTALKDAGYTQTEATRVLELSQNAISNYVSKNRIPEATILYKLSQLTGVSMEWLLSGNPDLKYFHTNVVATNDTVNPLSQDEIDLILLYRQLSDSNKLKIQGMIELKVSEEPIQKQKLSHSQDTNSSALLA